MRGLALSVAVAVVTTTCEAFQPLPGSPGSWSKQPFATRRAPSLVSPLVVSNHGNNKKIMMSNDSNNPQHKNRVRQFLASIRRRTRSLVTATLLVAASLAVTTSKPAHASAPVMALPKAEGRDPATEALLEAERRQQAATQKELQQMGQRAREIEASQGERARVKFEKEYKANQQVAADKKAEGLVELKRNLLKKGIDPSTDVEGKRQVVLYEKGVDLGEVAGTPFYLEKEFERTAFKRSVAYNKAVHRQVVACMAQDMENRGIDPVEYFAQHQDKTMALMDMPTASASAVLKEYQQNLEKYGQITVPKPGEVSAKEKMAAAALTKQSDPEAKKAARAEAKRLKAEEKAAKKAERERAKAEAKKAKAEAKKAKEEAKAAKKAAAAAAAAAGAAAAGAAAAGSAAQESAAAVLDTMTTADSATPAGEESISLDDSSSDMRSYEEPAGTTTVTRSEKKSLPIVPIAATLVVAGGGGFAFKVMRDRAAEAEEERQRQFRLLMGEVDGPATAPALEEIGKDEVAPSPAPEVKASEPTPVAPAPKKRRGGMKKMFGKKKSDRETDIMALVSEDAKAPDFSKLLAKILTFGAPGRFPTVLGLPGGTPMESFDLEKAKQLLSEARESSGLSLQESAEIFADVVNCMLIDIVDLASSSLKEKDEAVTVKSINIVVDFMNHAASLYDSVAEGVVIKPVTYGGDLSSSKLEQMYSTYAVSGMMTMFGGGENGDTAATDDFDSRVALLQDVFQISEKKAEGLMMKAVQKNMMQMMKDGKGMEGMEQMLGGMGGLGGIPGMEDGEGPSPEQLKEMLISLKEMKDSGSIPPEEFDAVKKQFKESFGSSLDDVVRDADEEGDLSGEDKELLDLMKAIMED